MLRKIAIKMVEQAENFAFERTLYGQYALTLKNVEFTADAFLPGAARDIFASISVMDTQKNFRIDGRIQDEIINNDEILNSICKTLIHLNNMVEKFKAYSDLWDVISHSKELSESYSSICSESVAKTREFLREIEKSNKELLHFFEHAGAASA